MKKTLTPPSVKLRRKGYAWAAAAAEITAEAKIQMHVTSNKQKEKHGGALENINKVCKVGFCFVRDLSC